MIISHVKIIAFQTIIIHCLWYFILLEKTVVYIINRIIHVCLGIPDLFLVLNMHDIVINMISFNTRNKSGISAQPCIILYIIMLCNVIKTSSTFLAVRLIYELK